MPIATTIRKTYSDRLSDLIKEGMEVLGTVKVEMRQGEPAHMYAKPPVIKSEFVDWPRFVQWRASCTTIIGQLLSGMPHHENTIKVFSLIPASKGKIEWAIATLRAAQDDLDRGFLADIELRVVARLSSDMLSDAEEILKENTPSHIEHVLAGVLAGIVLEHCLRDLCAKQSPPVATMKADGRPESLNTLIDRLKDSGLYTEVVAKQLRAWYAIRNSLAHGEFDAIDKGQVAAMVQGIGAFLAKYLG